LNYPNIRARFEFQFIIPISQIALGYSDVKNGYQVHKKTSRDDTEVSKPHPKLTNENAPDLT